jgi:hypothetical protein
MLVDLKKDEQLLRQFLWKTKNTNMLLKVESCCWKLKFLFGYTEKTHELLHLDKWKFVQ